jgi:hypothetical protein
MRAKLPAVTVSNARNHDSDKETIQTLNVVALIKGHLRTVVTCRCYMGRSSKASSVYASIWVSMQPYLSEDKSYLGFRESTSGTGSAGGWGYHKSSSAIGAAISNAGIELYGSPYGEPRAWHDTEGRAKTPAELRAEKRKADKQRCYIGGCGDSSVEMALIAIAQAVCGSRAKLLLVRG